MARIFFLHGYATACNSSCLDPFDSYLLIPEEREKTFGLSWNWTQVLLLHKQPLWPLDHGSSGNHGHGYWSLLAEPKVSPKKSENRAPPRMIGRSPFCYLWWPPRHSFRTPTTTTATTTPTPTTSWGRRRSSNSSSASRSPLDRSWNGFEQVLHFMVKSWESFVGLPIKPRPSRNSSLTQWH